jgi:hypothetical protein
MDFCKIQEDLRRYYDKTLPLNFYEKVIEENSDYRLIKVYC